jgi:hypothetical protein
MNRTLSEIVIDIESLLDCKHKNVDIKEDLDELELRVKINKSAVSESMFDRKQVIHIVDRLTPTATPVNVEFVPDSEWEHFN